LIKLQELLDTWEIEIKDGFPVPHVDYISPWRRLQALTPEDRKLLLDNLEPSSRRFLLCDFRMKMFRHQLPLHDDYHTWLFLAGRGTGKTWVNTNMLLHAVKQGQKHVAMLGATASDVRDVLVRGPAGVIAQSYPDDRTYDGEPLGVPIYSPANRSLTWANGARCILLSAEKEDRSRGGNFSFVTADELCAFQNEGAWELLLFALRRGDRPRAYVSTTPKNVTLIRKLIDDDQVMVTSGETKDNKTLPEAFIKRIYSQFEGSRLGRQELKGELLIDNTHALWTQDNIDRSRVDPEDSRKYNKIVVGVDPAITKNMGSDLTGIVVCAESDDNHYYVLEDLSLQASPLVWAQAVVDAYHKYNANMVVVEGNQGGELVDTVLKQVDNTLLIKRVFARNSKFARAEPVAALWELDVPKAHLVAHHANLEDELVNYDPHTSKHSPDRLDAMCWGLTELAVNRGDFYSHTIR